MDIGSKVRVVESGYCGKVIDSNARKDWFTVAFPYPVSIRASIKNDPNYVFSFPQNEIEEISEDEFQVYLLMNG